MQRNINPTGSSPTEDIDNRSVDSIDLIQPGPSQMSPIGEEDRPSPTTLQQDIPFNFSPVTGQTLGSSLRNTGNDLLLPTRTSSSELGGSQIPPKILTSSQTTSSKVEDYTLHSSSFGTPPSNRAGATCANKKSSHVCRIKILDILFLNVIILFKPLEP